ncbi:fimbrial protein [Stenotrophomonas maltophilia]|uniref:fimbrial protein n=1 Tax=Stenotrophomonas maltophilia TaxID=40324 RepID=UPI000C25B327|nr:fimbrial protein [Stenotrophomonas maltophilia]PJL41515.1 hypothetical protein B9Y56_12010 [Stenotrophomonas maltophilia]
MTTCNWIKRGPLALVLVAAGLGAAGEAAAACSVYPQTFEAITAVNIVGNAADVGESLTPWIASESEWAAACGPSSSGEYFQYQGLSAEVGTYTEGGVTYSVYSTPAAGIGVVVRLEPYTTVDPAGWPGGLRTSELHYVSGLPGYEGSSVLEQRLRIKFIKVGVTDPGETNLSAWRLLKMQLVSTRTGNVLQTEEQILGSFSITVEHRPLCYVQSKTVNMRMVHVPYFQKVGDSAPPVDYTVEMDCETDAGRVNYYLEEISPVVDKAKGIISTSGGAVGFGIQVLSGSGDPVEIGRSYPFGSSADPGRRSLAFKARYIRTESDASLLEAGWANAQVRYRVDYP